MHLSDESRPGITRRGGQQAAKSFPLFQRLLHSMQMRLVPSGSKFFTASYGVTHLCVCLLALVMRLLQPVITVRCKAPSGS